MRGHDQPDLEHADVSPPPRRRSSVGHARGRRSGWFWSAVGLAVAGAVVATVALVQGSGQGGTGPAPGTMVTAFLPGELQRVPAACTTVNSAVLAQYMPGRSKPAAAEPLEGGAASQCSWSVDQPQRYRFMEVALVAYTPSGLASGNGSATRAAQDAFVQARLGKQFPPRRSGSPKAKMTTISGLGQEAFSADQHYKRGGVLDMLTMVVRYRNVVITVIYEARTGGRFGADPVSTLRQGAEAAARSALAKLTA
ncbi:MAG: hypothetical protein ACM3ML_14515 [Micromonosporaceae bacterium]